MRELKIALLQLLPGRDTASNLALGLEACRRAAALGADIALFPEMWSCGYAFPQERVARRALAQPPDGDFVRSFGRTAAELGMAIAVTYLERAESCERNSLALFDRRGRQVLDYAKAHTCDFGEERVLGRGDGFRAAELDTAAGRVNVGAMICYDREFPESARLLMLRGAELVLVPNACPMELNRLTQLRARAFENMVGVATANYAWGQPDCNGHSSAFDGMAYRPGEDGSRDTLVVEAGENEGIYLAPFPLDAMRAYRSEEAHGNAYRRPGLYRALAEEAVSEPFLREDARR